MKISIANINEVAPYKVKEGNKGSLLFSTDVGDDYEVSFIEDEAILSGLLAYHLSFYPIKESGKFDKKISITILAIIESVLMENIGAIIYITDDADNKGYCRNRLFMRWFAYSQRIKGDRYILMPIADRAGVIIRNDNPYKNKYLSAVEGINSELQK